LNQAQPRFAVVVVVVVVVATTGTLTHPGTIPLATQ
jgi:hypothetical protein